MRADDQKIVLVAGWFDSGLRLVLRLAAVLVVVGAMFALAATRWLDSAFGLLLAAIMFAWSYKSSADASVMRRSPD